jgi:hypothetical protein
MNKKAASSFIKAIDGASISMNIGVAGGMTEGVLYG